MTIEQLPEDTAAAFRLITEILGEQFSFDQLLSYIVTRRNKPLGIRTVELPLPPGTTGCAIGLFNADIIGIRPNMDVQRQLPVRLHEASHFLLRHVPKYSAGAETATFEEFIRTPDLRNAVLRDRTNNYDTPRERSAEILARLLLKRIKQYNESIPEIASEVFLFGNK